MNINERWFKLVLKKVLENCKYILPRMEYRIRKIDRRQIVTTPLHSAATVELCRKLLKDGACVNARDIDGRTPLHHAILHRRGVEVVRELLRWGACGNACDFFKCTPLTIAIQLLGKDVVEIVRALLQHGANPNVHDYQGFSALTLAVYKRDLRLIREMLEWGADINFRNRAPIHCFLMFLTPLTEAVNGDEECAKLLIKMTVIKHFDNHKQIIDLYRFRKNSNFPKLSSFLEKCSCEILQMKSYVVKDKYSLFDFVTSSRKCFKPLYWDDCKIKKIPFLYPIYHDIVFKNIQPYLIRAQLLNKLRNFQLFAVIKNNNDAEGKKIYLNSDCFYKIAEYLTNDELSALIEVYNII